MRIIIFVVVTIFACAVMATEYYSDIYDKTNVESILKNERLFKAYINCILDKGSCTADARAFKTTFTDAIATNCARCTQRQIEIAELIIKHLKEQRPETYNLVVQKYDPDNKYIDKFIEFLKRRNKEMEDK